MFFDINDALRTREVENSAWIEKVAQEIELCRGRVLAKANTSLEFNAPFWNVGVLRGVTHGVLWAESGDGMSILHYRLSLAPPRYLFTVYILAGALGILYDGLRKETVGWWLVGIIFALFLYFVMRFVSVVGFRRLVRRTAGEGGK